MSSLRLGSSFACGEKGTGAEGDLSLFQHGGLWTDYFGMSA